MCATPIHARRNPECGVHGIRCAAAHEPSPSISPVLCAPPAVILTHPGVYIVRCALALQLLFIYLSETVFGVFVDVSVFASLRMWGNVAGDDEYTFPWLGSSGYIYSISVLSTKIPL